MSASSTSSPRIGGSEINFRSWGGPAAVALVAAGAAIFDTLTPQSFSVTAVYVGLVLIGYWLRDPRSALALALLATPLIIIGHWLSTPDSTPEWEGWVNRGDSIGSVWLAAFFVWRIRVLERESKWLASIVAFGDDAIVSKNLDGIITSWNAGAERLFNYTAEEAIGQPITIVIPQDRQDEERTILTRIRRGERIDHFETIRQRKHGSLIVISLTVSPEGYYRAEAKPGADRHPRSGSRAPQQELAFGRPSDRHSFSVRHIRGSETRD